MNKDICYRIRQVISNSSAKYKFYFDEKERMFKVIDTEAQDFICRFYSHNAAIDFLAEQILKDAAIEINQERGER